MGEPATNNEADAWLAELDPSLAAQFQAMGEDHANADPASASAFHTPTRSADSKPAHVKIIRVTDDDLPPVKGVDLPTVTDPEVEITDRDASNKKSKLKQSEVLKSPDYVDNGIKSLKAQPTQMTLEVKMMEIFYTKGGSLEIKMDWVKDGTNPLTDTYVRKDGMIIPVNKNNVVLFDGNNTPNIVICYEYVKQEMRRRSAERVQIAEIVAAFASAVAALGGAAAGAHEITGGGAGGGYGGGEEEEGGQGGRGTGGEEEEEGGESGTGQGSEGGAPPAETGGGTNEPSGGQSSGGDSHDPGTADTQPAPPRRPEQGHPLDSTAEVKPKGGETHDNDSPKSGGTKDTDSPKGGGKKGPVENPVKPVPHIPDEQKITIRTPRGPEEMTAGEYRKRWHAADRWLAEENQKLNPPKGAGPPPELTKKAQEKFGLDNNWRSISNPYIYGPL